MKSNVPGYDKYDLLMDFDKVFGLNLHQTQTMNVKHADLPTSVQELIVKRTEARESGDFVKADSIRAEINQMGYDVEDTSSGIKVKKR